MIVQIEMHSPAQQRAGLTSRQMNCKDYCIQCKKIIGINRSGLCRDCRSIQCKDCKKPFLQYKVLSKLCAPCLTSRNKKASLYPEGAI